MRVRKHCCDVLGYAFLEKYFLKATEHFFCAYIASSKHSGCWDNSRKLFKPEMELKVCITVLNSPDPLRV